MVKRCFTIVALLAASPCFAQAVVVDLDRKTAEVAGEAVDWAHLSEFGVFAAAHPGYAHRYCPGPDRIVVEANAQARTEGGCVLWKPGVQTLRWQTVARKAD